MRDYRDRWPRLAALFGWRRVRVIDRLSLVSFTAHGPSFRPEQSHYEWRRTRRAWRRP